MKKEEFYRLSSDGVTQLHGFTWSPEGEVRAVLQLVHGMVEYIDRYDAFAAYLADRGIACIGHDHLGHGKSVTDETKLGHFADNDGDKYVIEDMHRITEDAKERFPGKKVFVLGHSMGSFLLRKYITLYSGEIDGAIVMGTGYIPAVLAGTGKTLSGLTKALKGAYHRSKLLTGLALGSNNKPFEPARTPNDWLSRNEENVDRYNADPLCGYMFTAASYVSFFTVIESLARKEGFDRIRKDLPVLITSGENDPVGGKAACPQVLQEFEALGMTDVTMKLYPEDRHEILNEVDRDEVYENIEKWLESKL
ncbi:MAG: lysophospholipase [Lachnospiraceae bacterium]|nr:lysophospholipase [Lachnospiraceae bacterium]